MRTLIADADESHLRSVQIALDARGIWHVASVAHVPGESITKHGNCVLVDDGDYERAMAVVEALQKSSKALWSPRGLRIAWAMAIVVALAMLAMAVVRAAGHSPP